MKNITRFNFRLLSMVITFSLVFSCFCLSAIPTAADGVKDQILTAAKAYVSANGNSATATGLLTAVQAVEPGATLDTANDYYFKHAVPGVADDTVDYPLDIPGSDGALVAVFAVSGTRYSVAVPLAHETEIIHITETAVVGTSAGFTYDENGNVTGYSGTADKIVLPADYNGTFLRITDQTSVDNVKVLIYNNKKYVRDYAFYDWDGLVAVQFKSGEAAWKLTGNGSNHNDTRGFASCDNLKYVRLPDIVSLSWYSYVLHNNMFDGCGKLENLSHPSLSTSSNKTTSWAAYNGTAIRDYVFPQYYASGSNSSNPTFQQYSAASPTVPAATRNVHWYTDAMTTPRAVALAVAKGNELVREGATDSELTDGMIAAITGSSDASTVAEGISAVLTDATTVQVTAGDDSFEFSFGEPRTYDDLPTAVKTAADTYVKTQQNAATAAGLLAAVRAVDSELTLDTANDYYIKHAVPGVTDDTNDYPLNIAGSDGAVAAVFCKNNVGYGYSCAFAHETEIIHITETAVVGSSEGFTYSEGNVTAYSGTADKIVIPDTYTNGSIAHFADLSTVQQVKVVIVNNRVYLRDNAFENWDGLIAFQMASTTQSTAWNVFANPNSIDAQFQNCDNLKYVKFPDWINTPSWASAPFPGYLFNGSSNLENVAIPQLNSVGGSTAEDKVAPVNYKVFTNNRIREYIFPKKWCDSQGYLNGSLVGAGTRNIHWFTDTMTFVRAAAYAAAKANEVTKTVGTTDLSAALTAIRGSITGSADAATVESGFTYEWETVTASDLADLRLLTVSDASGQYIPISYGAYKALISLSLQGADMPAFQMDQLLYETTVPMMVNQIQVQAQAADGAVITAITGEGQLDLGQNEIKVFVTTTEGKQVTYVIRITRQSRLTIPQKRAKAAFETYVTANGNSATAEGTLAAVQTIFSTATLAGADFALIPATSEQDGAVAAVFTVDGKRFGFAATVPADPEAGESSSPVSGDLSFVEAAAKMQAAGGRTVYTNRTTEQFLLQNFQSGVSSDVLSSLSFHFGPITDDHGRYYAVPMVEDENRILFLSYQYTAARGDLDGEESVNAGDLTRMSQYLLGQEVSVVPDAADVDDSDSVNILDLIVLKKILSGTYAEQSVAAPPFAEYLHSDCYSDSVAIFKAYHQNGGTAWHGLPVNFTYDASLIPAGKELLSAEVIVSETGDFTNTKTYSLENGNTTAAIYNLKANTKYYYRFVLTMTDETVVSSDSFMLKTADTPRILRVRGKSTGNFRDIGGWKTTDGKRVKQGLLIRGPETDGGKGATVSDNGKVDMLVDLGILADYDLRGDITPTNILNVNLFHYNMYQYSPVFTAEAKAVVRQLFHDLSNPSNYPGYLHCTHGMDRTGTACFILEALLGVSEEDMVRDYQLSAFYHERLWGLEDFYLFMENFENNYEGNTWKEKAENFLLSAGVTISEIETIRSIFLED